MKTRVRKIPGAARRLLREIGPDWTKAEWQDVLGVAEASLRKLATRDGGIQFKPGKGGPKSYSVRAEHNRRVHELSRIVDRAVRESPDPRPERRRSASAVTQARHRRSSALSEIPGGSRAQLRWQSISLRRSA